MSTSWDEYAAGWDEDEAVRTYAAAAHASLIAELNRRGLTLSGMRALDFGCGSGQLTERLAEECRQVDALDTSPAMLDVVRAKIDRSGWAHVRALDALPEGDSTYDLVVCSSVCAFLDDYPTTVRALVDRLGPGGIFVQWDWEIDPGDDEPFGLSRDAVRAALLGAGTEDVVVQTGFRVSFEGEEMAPIMGAGRRPSLERGPGVGRG